MMSSWRWTMLPLAAVLTWPKSWSNPISRAKEPDLPLEELTRLDALADQLELQRLEKLQVLQDPSTVPSDSKGSGRATLRPVAVQQQPVLMSTQ